MESICFTSKDCRRRPNGKVVCFEDYQRIPELEELGVESSPELQKRIKRHTLRRRLESVCLVLEVCVCIAVFLFTVSAAIRFWLS